MRLAKASYGTVVSLVLISVLVPNLVVFYQMIVNAFKSIDDFNGAGEYLGQGVNVFMPPRRWTLSSFAYFIEQTTAIRAFVNTVILSVCGVAIVLVLGAVAALVLAQYRVWFTDHLVMFLIGAQAIPYVMTILTTFRVTRALHWMDTYQGVVVALAAQFLPFVIFLFHSYYVDFSRDLLEAAEVDGASFLQVFLKIVLPVSGSIVATVGILIFIFSWATYLIGVVVLRSEDMYLLAMVIQNMEIALRFRVPVFFASFVVFSMPMVAVARWAQRHITPGMLAGAVK